MAFPAPKSVRFDWLPLTSRDGCQPRFRLLAKGDRARFRFDLLEAILAVRALSRDDCESLFLAFTFRQRALTHDRADANCLVFAFELPWYIDPESNAPVAVFLLNVASLTRPCCHALPPCALVWLRRRKGIMRCRFSQGFLIGLPLETS